MSFVSALDRLGTEVLSPPDRPKPPVPISSLAGGRCGQEGRDPWQSPAQHSSCSPGLLTGQQLRAGHFHPEPEMCSVLACIPGEQLLSRADHGGNSLGSFLPPQGPLCELTAAPPGRWFLSQPLPFPNPHWLLLLPWERPGSREGKGAAPAWVGHLPACHRHCDSPALAKTHPLAPAGHPGHLQPLLEPQNAKAALGMEIQLQSPAVPPAASSLGCPNSHTDSRARASLPCRTFPLGWGCSPLCRVQGWGHGGGRAHPPSVVAGVTTRGHGKATGWHCTAGTAGTSCPPHSPGTRQEGRDELCHWHLVFLIPPDGWELLPSAAILPAQLLWGIRTLNGLGLGLGN